MSAFSKLLVTGALALGALTATASAASADVTDCVPERVRSMSDRLDFRCQGVNRWFIAWRSSTDAALFNQMLALLNSSVVTGKSLKIYYNLDSSSNGIPYAVEIFR